MKFLSKFRSFYSLVLSVLISVAVVAASAGATTISTNISTSGTLSVTGGSTLQSSTTVSADFKVGAQGQLLASTTAALNGFWNHGSSTMLADMTFGDASTDNVFMLAALKASSTGQFTGLTSHTGGLISYASSTVTSTLMVNCAFGASSTAAFTNNVWGYASSSFLGSFNVGDATTTDRLLITGALNASG